MCLSTEERDSIQSLVEASKETEDIAKKLADFLAKDGRNRERAREFVAKRVSLHPVPMQMKLAK